jgi:hypothetical protein
MSKGRVAALLIVALLIVVLIFNKGDVNINVLFTTIAPLKSMAFLSFAAIGVIVGILLK